MDVFKTTILKMNSQVQKKNLSHSFIFFLFCNFFCFLTFKFSNFYIPPLSCLFLILIIGVSHGSLDHEKGKKLFKIFKIDSISIFYFTYILISTLVVIVWMLFPSISLIIFLLVASYHFGKEDTQFLINKVSFFDQLLFFLKGLLIILAPMFFNFNDTILIFKLLMVENESFYLTLDFIESNSILPGLIAFSTFSSIYLFLKEFHLKKFIIFFDYFSILILNYILTPLVAFTIYFCFLHSVRHSMSLIYEIDKQNFTNGIKIFIKKAIPLTILTGIFCLIGLYLLNNNYDLDSSILKIIFIGLASLTFPHILLEYFIEKYEK